MIVNYDPIHQVVTLDFEDGKQPLKLTVGRLIVSYDFTDISAIATMEGELEISIIPVEGRPIDIYLYPTGKRRWLIKAVFPE